MIIPSGAGGITDILGRVIAPKLGDSLGQQVVVDNRPGASGVVGSNIVAKSAPDGYTLLMVFPSHPVNQSLYRDVPYDTVKAFAPITLVSAVSPVLIVNSQFPASSVPELIAIAKEKPGQLNHGSVGSGGIGTLPHLGGEMFKVMTGTNMVHISYKGAILTIPDLLGGRLHVVFSDMPIALPHANSGKLRAIAVTSSTRFGLAPGIPTAIEAGLPGFVLDNWWGLLVMNGTPPSVVSKINAGIVKGLQQAEVKERYTGQGLEAVTSTPQSFTDLIKSDHAKYVKLIKDAGIKIE